MSDYDMMRISDNYDDDGIDEEQAANKEEKSEREKYFDFYDDVKQPCKYKKEDW